MNIPKNPLVDDMSDSKENRMTEEGRKSLHDWWKSAAIVDGEVKYKQDITILNPRRFTPRWLLKALPSFIEDLRPVKWALWRKAAELKGCYPKRWANSGDTADGHDKPGASHVPVCPNGEVTLLDFFSTGTSAEAFSDWCQRTDRRLKEDRADIDDAARAWARCVLGGKGDQ